MGMKVKDIFRISLFKGTIVLGGERGLDNEIEWFNLMEIVDTIPSLQPGEFLISTAFAFDNENISKGLIGKLKERGLSGIGIQVGYYIDEVPKHLIEEGDSLDFPVLLIPPKITFSHITKALYKELMAYKSEEGENQESNNSFKSVIADLLEGKSVSYQQEKYMQEYCIKDEYSCCYLWALSIAHTYDGIVLRSDINNCLKSLTDIVENQEGKCHIETFQGVYIMLIRCPLANKEKLYKQANIVLQELYTQNLNLHFLIGYSSNMRGVQNISQCFREALSAMQALINIGVKKGLLAFKNIEAIKPLQNKVIKDGIIKYSNEIMVPIIQSDREKDTEYYKTLKVYIESNFNQSETAKTLDIHRHTLTNRLESLKKLLDTDFLDNISYLKYNLAVVISEFYR